MRFGPVLLVAALLVLVTAPSASAHVAVRLCNSPSHCTDVAAVPVGADCHVDIMKQGLGKPPRVRVSDCA